MQGNSFFKVRSKYCSKKQSLFHTPSQSTSVLTTDVRKTPEMFSRSLEHVKLSSIPLLQKHISSFKNRLRAKHLLF